MHTEFRRRSLKETTWKICVDGRRILGCILKKQREGGVNWIHMTQDRKSWLAVAYTQYSTKNYLFYCFIFLPPQTHVYMNRKYSYISTALFKRFTQHIHKHLQIFCTRISKVEKVSIKSLNFSRSGDFRTELQRKSQKVWRLSWNYPTYLSLSYGFCCLN
jgi:hypothetical protein